MVSFTGSTRADREVARRAGETLKKVALELGGKSATAILPDADSDLFQRAVRHGVGKCFMNSGQSCNALTRLLVPAEQAGTAVKLAAADRVRGYIQREAAEGADHRTVRWHGCEVRVVGRCRRG